MFLWLIGILCQLCHPSYCNVFIFTTVFLMTFSMKQEFYELCRCAYLIPQFLEYFAGKMCLVFSPSMRNDGILTGPC